ncbi:hypothetical protein [Flavobacterium channae]|uniref:hypothetical protein n=1 Tax=Flavobacterium channae TaxID=2897181 RepID=UPI001E487928|nr:hypothetical protein [Flavobacterium channae]UGS22793.1 hypothetical protein LOS89_08375 [Flavobacterium channae]
MYSYLFLFIIIAFAFVYIIYDSKKEIKSVNKSKCNNFKPISINIIEDETYDEEETLLWEEEYLMIEIIPATNYKYLLDNNIDKSKALSSYAKIKTETLKIKFSEITEFLKGIGINKYKKIIYFGACENPEEIKDQNTIAYGCLGDTIFIEHKDNIVENIWFVSYNRTSKLNTEIVNTLNRIGIKYDLLLVDNYPVTEKIVDLKNLDEIESYFKLRVN